MTGKPHFRKIKKDYQTKNLQNPFFRRRPAGKSRRSLKCLIWGIIVLSLLGAWFFLAAPFWRLKKIEVVGLTRLSDGELKNFIWQQAQNRRLLFLKQSNLFLFDKQAAAEKILADFNFSSLEIKKKLPDTLEIRVGERSLAFIFQQGNDLLYSSRDGSVIREAVVAATDRIKYPLLENRSDDNLLGPDNKIDLTADYLSFLLELSERLAAYPDLPLEKFIVTDELNALSAKFVNGPTVYFNTSLPVLDQVNRLLLVKKGKIKDNFSKVNYIDLRYGDRIFINPELP